MSRILIIEDDPQVLDVLKKVLVKEGYSVDAAVDGNAGMESYRKSPSDLIISDLLMPGKGGIETIMELRNEFPAAKVIAISGGGRVDPQNHLKVAAHFGADFTLAKPFENHELLTAVKQVLN